MKTNSDKSTLAIAIFSIITILFWIGFDLYHIKTISTIPESLSQIVIPLNPEIDKNAMQNLINRKDVFAFEKGQVTTATTSASTSGITAD